jgi:hypothetical protein
MIRTPTAESAFLIAVMAMVGLSLIGLGVYTA